MARSRFANRTRDASLILDLAAECGGANRDVFRLAALSRSSLYISIFPQMNDSNLINRVRKDFSLDSWILLSGRDAADENPSPCY